MPDGPIRPLRAARFGVAILCAGIAVAGCASANKTAPVRSKTSPTAGAPTTSGGSSMAGMNMGSGNGVGGQNGAPASTKGISVNGIRPVASQELATAGWQGMKITARTMTPARFVIFNGTSEQMVKPTKHTSFHLMVDLDDAHTGVPIPYASVWATISRDGKVVYDERQWPMLSAFMGPHYGNNVTLPGAGKYQLTLLITPPVAARHMEYAHVWLKPHRVTVPFSWTPTS